MDKPKTLKQANKVLMEHLKKIYPFGKLCAAYDAEHNYVWIKPFKRAQIEFTIHLEEDIYCIMRDRDFAASLEAGGSHDLKLYELQGVGSLQEGFDYPKIIKYLKKLVEEYVKEEQDFYDECVEIHRDFGVVNEEEARRLAGIIYPKGWFKELGVKR